MIVKTSSVIGRQSLHDHDFAACRGRLLNTIFDFPWAGRSSGHKGDAVESDLINEGVLEFAELAPRCDRVLDDLQIVPRPRSEPPLLPSHAR
jgi:hypothetical protein